METAGLIPKNARDVQRKESSRPGFFFQPKLTINAPGDVYEQEADAMADRVMRMPDPVSSKQAGVFFNPAGSYIRRKCVSCEDEEKTIHRKENTNGETEVNHENDQYISSLSGRGQSLPEKTRQFFEPRLGHDFSDVRVHTNSEAAISAKSINALAYTAGNNIIFNHGRYEPDTKSGQRLLAHELTHVLQQKCGIQKKIQRVDDASFESLAGGDKGISKKTMVSESSIMGQTYTATCGIKDYSIGFRFSKAFKGDYPYVAAGRDVRGVYVKIETSMNDKILCGRCTPMKLLQVWRNFKQGTSGKKETGQPNGTIRDIRGGWDKKSSPSRGWEIDTTDTATSPYVTNLSYTAKEGSESIPAIIWDSPGFWTNKVNSGTEFYTGAVCTDASGKKWVAACINWGFYTDSTGKISFSPATPIASCSYPQEMKDASERWDAIAGNKPTGITF